MIRSENARLTGWVFVDIAGRDMGGYVAEAREAVAAAVGCPPVMPRPSLASTNSLQKPMPASRSLSRRDRPDLLLLMLHFGRLDRTLIIMASLPFGLIGGLWAVWLAGYNLSVAVAVGHRARRHRGRNSRDHAALYRR